MAGLFFFDQKVPTPSKIKTNSSNFCTVEVLDCHGMPEIRIGPEGAAHEGFTATFESWSQYEEFVEAVNDLHSRLNPKNQ
jgi:hypothetical protein